MSQTELRQTPPRLREEIAYAGDGAGADGGDAAELAAALRRVVRGEVRFDAGSRALYATDASNYRQTPIGVVLPRDKEDVIQAVAVCRRFGAPILGRGGGTSLAGQCCNTAVVLDFSKYMNRVLSIDPEARLARVQPGVVLDELQAAVKAHGLVFGPDPATHTHCTLGGMIGNNSCGIHSVMAEFYGPGARTSDNLESLEVLTYDGAVMAVGPTPPEELAAIIAGGGRRGDIYRRLRDLGREHAELLEAQYPDIPRRVSGYENLDQFIPGAAFNVAQALAGTECTCVIMLEATVRLIPNPAVRSLLVLGYPDVFAAGDHVPLIRRHRPIGLEGMDDLLIHYQRVKEMHPHELDLLPEGTGFLLVEFGGEDKAAAEARAQKLMDELAAVANPPHMVLYDEPEKAEWLWDVRESGLGATARIPNKPDTWPGWEDTAVHPDDIGDYLRDLRALYDKYGYEAALYGHFGQGLIHCRVTFDLRTPDGLVHFRRFLWEAADLVVSYGGTLSGEHGDGQARGELLARMYSEEMLGVFREFKSIWDPAWKMNPGKVIQPAGVTEHLRLGETYNPWEPPTRFQFPDDDFSFSRATLRCVGVGKCRRAAGGTMCPSYRVTGEEAHSTRGRARLLFEMLQGESVRDGWQDENVKEALDLCLSCKGCLGDCPVNVDMATYKAEFLSHYYDKKLRPRAAYAFGLIYWWARLAARVPGIANFFTQTAVFSRAAKWAAGVAPERRIPSFARQPFTAWFRAREAPAAVPGQPRVMLWPDTFNTYFHPETAKAAVAVLEAAGFEVVIPERPLCCGRPLYDYGMLGLAKRQWRQILETLRPQIRAGLPLIGLEPSCTAAFRDELRNLFPHDEDARRLSGQTHTLAEFLQQKVPDYAPPRLPRQALLHGHCHHAAVMGMEAETKLLRRMDLDVELLDSGCCGMAGNFGFEAGEKYDVSLAVGEQVLLPAVRRAATDRLIVADGFSCREQIAQTTTRRALHTAQVLKMGLDMAHNGTLPPGAYPETRYVTEEDRTGNRTAVAMLAAAMLGLLAAVSWLWRRR
ncbi:MAG: FAD-binding oxidoreductase [Anaerolineales bacterium]|nr:FAD-binding oxidoreductase [Anaerolineales bacterium]